MAAAEKTLEMISQLPSAFSKPLLTKAAPVQPLRLAVIGCGAIAESMHLPVLAGHEAIHVAALVDRNAERAGRLAEAYKVPRVLADANELATGEIDAAIIATPPFHHAPCALALIERGVHVLVEKPMATNYADAARMVDSAERHGVALAVGFFRRLNPSVRLMKALLDSGWLGRPLRFVAEGGGMYNWAAATLGNMRKEWSGGGVLIDFGSHLLDLLFALFTEPAEVLDYCDNALGGTEADCRVKLRLTHEGSAVEGVLELARTRKVGNMIYVECERGSLEFQIGERFRIIVVPRDLKLVDTVLAARRGGWFDAAWEGEDETVAWYETFRKQIDDWVDAIRSGREPTLSGRSCLPAVRVIDQCYAHPQPLLEPWVQTWGDGNPAQAAAQLEQVNGDARAQAPPGRNGAKRRVLVTGATGFIGSRVAEILHLRDGWDVRALVHNPGNASRLARLPVEMVQADLKSPEEARRLVSGCDAVVHCAIGTAWGQRREIFSVTVDGTRHLAEAALNAGVRRVVHLSTMSVYGNDNELSGILDESTPIRPSRGSDYEESKAQAERAIEKAARRGLSAVILRPARVYGPFSRIFITRPLEAMSVGGFRWLGQPDVPADMVFVDNLVEVICRCLDAAPDKVNGEIFNVGDGTDITWREFYRYFADPFDIDLTNTPVDEPRRNAQGRRLLGLPGRWYRGIKSIVSAKEFRSFGRRILETDPIGTLPRSILNRFPSIERAVRRLVHADDSLPIYRRSVAAPAELIVHMGSGGAQLNIDKLRRQLNYEPPVASERAMELTLEWVKYARIVG